LGIDLNPVKPTEKLPNLQFKVMDFNEEWDFEEKFDFVHVRFLGFALPEKALRSVYENLRPGGWLEITEWVTVLRSSDHSTEGTAFETWNQSLQHGLRTLGSSAEFALRYPSLLRRNGFVQVTERRNWVPINAWAPGKQLQRIGSMMTDNVTTFMDGATGPVFTDGLGWTPERTQSMLEDARKQIGDTSLHSFMTL
jgi:SAM-dependent methyltransferase